MTKPPLTDRPWPFAFMPPWMQVEKKPPAKQPARQPLKIDSAYSAKLDRALVVSATLIALLWSMSSQ